jgi:hypothetical protein
MKFFKICTFLWILLFFTGCDFSSMGTNGVGSLNLPFFMTTEPLQVKKLSIPIGTRLTYNEHLSKKGKQNEMMSEDELIDIDLPIGQTIDWGGIPVRGIDNSLRSAFRGLEKFKGLHGIIVFGDVNQIKDDERTNLHSKLWQYCDNGILGIAVKNIDDWSFNTKNFSDVETCSKKYQRFFKEDASQQKFLDEIFTELIKSGSK